MQTIQQNTVTNFHAPEFQDAIIVLPIMDALVAAIEQQSRYDAYKALDRNERDNYQYVSEPQLRLGNVDFAYIYEVLCSFGFCATRDPQPQTLEPKH